MNVQIAGQELNRRHRQKLLNLSDETPWHVRLLVRHRRLLGLALPAAFFHFCWWGIAFRYNLWHLFRDKYFMSITMAFGSIIAGESQLTQHVLCALPCLNKPLLAVYIFFIFSVDRILFSYQQVSTLQASQNEHKMRQTISGV